MKRNTYTSASKNYPVSLFKVTFAILFFCFIGSQATAQDASAGKTIRGTVRFSEDNESAPGVNIYLKGSTAQGTYSDPKGQFEFPRQLKPGEILVFSFIGRKTLEYIVPDQIDGALEIVMGPEYIEMVEDVLVEGHDPSRSSGFAGLFHRIKRDR
jgi:hypothetical protein